MFATDNLPRIGGVGLLSRAGVIATRGLARGRGWIARAITAAASGTPMENVMIHQPKAMTISGWILTALLSLLLLFSATMKFVNPPDMSKQFVEHLGYPAHLALPIGVVEVACLVIFLIPRTAALGAILLTGYLGGATATHLRVGDPFFAPVIIGMAVWLALFLRDPRIRALIPIRRGTARD